MINLLNKSKIYINTGAGCEAIKTSKRYRNPRASCPIPIFIYIERKLKMRNKAQVESNSNACIRINKYISEKGLCSRREADELIRQGRVTINGTKAEMGSKVYPGDTVKLGGKPLKPKDPPVYLAFNKPAGIVCTTDKKEKNNIIDYIDYPRRIFPIGRLDKESEGLIFLTSDGDIVNKILRATTMKRNTS